MADATDTKFANSAEKAYAAAAEKVEAKPAVQATVAKTEAKPVEVKAPAASKTDAAIAAAKAEAPKAAPVAVKAAPVAKKAPATKKAAAAKKTTVKTVKKAVVKKAPAKKPAVKVAAKKTVSAKPAAAKGVAAVAAKLKDTIMTKTQTQTEEFTARVKEALTEAQDRAKTAYEKSSALFGEYGEFTKGNVEALVESSKILAAGVQDMGRTYVAESKSAFETLTADVKELAAVRSPNDFFQLQGKLLRRNFDSAVAATSKNAEATVKLANEAFAPISSRVSVAIDKVRKAA